ncbi:MAG: ABC transporter ATP-binding protein [Planctomycetota bacterium]|nr:ABC transporter ATP-binding protein [Planctomycetota bacterium]
MVQIDCLVKNYPDVRAVDGLDLEIPDGQLFAFLGPNGAGKTTTIRILAGLTRMTSGAVRIGGVDIERHPRAAKRLCGLAAQQINLDGELTVLENLDFHGRLFAIPRPRRLARAEELLDYVELGGRRDSLVKTLSGGLKRRLMLARALLHEPRLLILDEPTVGLDPAIRRKVWGLIKKANADGVGVFMTTHYIEEAEFLADRVAFMHQGRLVADGPPTAIMKRLGGWAVDRYGPTGMTTEYYADRAAAAERLELGGAAATLRRVNLEDAFLALTGKRVQ